LRASTKTAGGGSLGGDLRGEASSTSRAGVLGEAMASRTARVATRQRPRPSASTVGKRKGKARGRERRVSGEGELALGSAQLGAGMEAVGGSR